MTSVATDIRFGVNVGRAVKVACKAATTANISLSGEQTIDGVSCVTDDRVLVKDQTTGADDGIYLVDTGTWTRSADFDGAYDVGQGTLVLVLSGTTNQGFWQVSTSDPITIGTTSIAFTRSLENDAANISFLQSGSGAQPTTLEAAIREIHVSVVQYDVLDVTNGVNGASAAIQKAVNALGTGGGIVFFKKPTVSYLIDAAVDLSGKSNIVFEGQGGVEFQTGNSTKLEAKSTLTGAMFTCDESNATRCGAFTFRRLHFDGNQQNVDAFYIHGNSASNKQARFLEWEECSFESLRTGAWLGNYTAETPNLTYLLGANFYRCLFVDVVRPIVADAGALDGLNCEQVWMVDESNRMTHGVSVLTSGTVFTAENLWIACGDSVAYAIYFALPTCCTIKDSAIEANDGGETFVGLYQPTGAASRGGIILDNVRINHTQAAAVAVDVGNAAGMEMRSCYFMGNVNVAGACIVHAQNVLFSGAFGYTGTTANVYVDGEANGTCTPALTFATPGDLSIAYSLQQGSWSKVGKKVTVYFSIITSTFTHTTAAGNLVLSGLPFTSVATYTPSAALGIFSGITAAGKDYIGVHMNASAQNAIFYKSGSGVAQQTVSAADMPTGGTVLIYGELTYRATT